MVKKILSIVLWVITAAAIVVLFIFARESYLNTPLKSINLVPAVDSGFVRRNVLHEEIEKQCEHSMVGTVNMIKIQGTLRNVVFDLIYRNFDTIEVLFSFLNKKKKNRYWMAATSFCHILGRLSLP